MKPFLLFLLSFVFLEGKIIQSNRIEDLTSYVNASTWVLFDLDDTLIEGENQLGRAKWYEHEVQKLMKNGLKLTDAHNHFYPQWILSQTICPTRTLEPHTPSIVAKAQKMATHVIGLTARHPSIASLSIEQLEKLSIDFSINALPFPDGVALHATLYRGGIWFLTDFQSKGEAFRDLLKASESHPNRIVFIDDHRSHLEAMEKALSEFDLEFIGIHYTKAEERPFNAQIADLQYKALPEILSDAEALLCLKKY